jgi:hypothetical protein
MQKEKRIALIAEIMAKHDITLTDIIDMVITENAIIGVGLISLGDNLKEYCYDKLKNKG